jgi:protein TonB
MVNRPEAPPAPGVPGLDDGSPIPGGASEIFRGQSTTSVVRPDMGGRLRVSSTTVEALVVHKTIPVYPAIAKTAGIQGTVVLAATISKAGTIENLRVVSGHPMLQQAALDAVKTWLYRPYQLNGQPVEVETTVNVVFTLTR